MRRVLSRLLRWGTTAIRCFAPMGLATTSIPVIVARPLLGSTLVVKMPIVVVLRTPVALHQMFYCDGLGYLLRFKHTLSLFLSEYQRISVRGDPSLHSG